MLFLIAFCCQRGRHSSHIDVILPAAGVPKAEGEDDDADAVAEAADDEPCCSVVPVGDDAWRFCCCCCCCWLEDDDESVVAVARSKEERGRAFLYRGSRCCEEGGRERGRRGGNSKHWPEADDVLDVEADRELARLLAAAEAVEIEEKRSIVLLLLFCNLPLCTLEAAARTARIDPESENKRKQFKARVILESCHFFSSF